MCCVRSHRPRRYNMDRVFVPSYLELTADTVIESLWREMNPVKGAVYNMKDTVYSNVFEPIVSFFTIFFQFSAFGAVLWWRRYR